MSYLLGPRGAIAPIYLFGLLAIGIVVFPELWPLLLLAALALLLETLYNSFAFLVIGLQKVISDVIASDMITPPSPWWLRV